MIDLLVSIKSLVYLIVIACLIVFNNFMLKAFTRKLRLFEADVDRFQSMDGEPLNSASKDLSSTQDVTIDDLYSMQILPPRDTKQSESHPDNQ